MRRLERDQLQGALSRRKRLRALEHVASRGSSEGSLCDADTERCPGPFIAASDYMKMLPETLGKWLPGQLVSLGTDGFAAARAVWPCATSSK